MEVKNIRGGQVRPYADSIYQYKITSDKPEEKVEEHCAKEVHRCSNKLQGGCFTGSTGFPFGLDSYYKFNKMSDGKFSYTVCEPYTD